MKNRVLQRDVAKPHRCPQCWAVAVDMERVKWWRVYTCCRCGSRFARWPRLAALLHEGGVRCNEHRGDTVKVTVRMPRSVAHRAEVKALVADMTLDDYLAALVPDWDGADQ